MGYALRESKGPHVSQLIEIELGLRPGRSRILLVEEGIKGKKQPVVPASGDGRPECAKRCPDSKG